MNYIVGTGPLLVSGVCNAEALLYHTMYDAYMGSCGNALMCIYYLYVMHAGLSFPLAPPF